MAEKFLTALSSLVVVRPGKEDSIAGVEEEKDN